MKINQPAPTKFSAYDHRASSIQTSGAYKVGQILEAIVLSNSRHGRVSLRIGNAEVIASSNIALLQNAHLSLKVTQLQPQLLLRVMPAPDNNPLLDVMKNMLPKQTSLAPLLAELTHKTQLKAGASSQPELRAAGKLLIAAIPERNNIKQADGLQRAIMQSGLFLEAKLANSAALKTFDLSTDLKSLLLRYLNALTQNQKDLAATKHTPAQVDSKQYNSKTPSPLLDRPPFSQSRLTPNESLSAINMNADAPALLKKLQGMLTRSGPPAAGEHPPSHLPRVMSSTSSLAQGMDADSSVLLKHLQSTLAKSGPLQSFTAKTIDQALVQAGIKQSVSEIPPPLRGRLPFNHPRVTHNPSFVQDNQLNSPAMFKKLEGAIARLGLLQVATAENFEDGKSLWQLEIPVRQGNAIEMVSLTIEKEQKETSQEKQNGATWAINLSLDLPQLGPLQSRISMDASGLSTIFWSESTKTLSVIENRLAELRANLEQHGLETHNLSCRAGQQQPAAQSPLPDSPLIDYRI